MTSPTTNKTTESHAKPPSYIININVSGKTFSAKLHNLKKYPNTLLGSDLLQMFYDSCRGDYFFDRDPDLFHLILNYYRVGKIHISESDCPGAFQDELDFFGIPQSAIDECCVNGFRKTRGDMYSCSSKYDTEIAKMSRSNSNTFLRCSSKHDKKVTKLSGGNSDTFCSNLEGHHGHKVCGQRRKESLNTTTKNYTLNHDQTSIEKVEVERRKLGYEFQRVARKEMHEKEQLLNCKQSILSQQIVSTKMDCTLGCEASRKEQSTSGVESCNSNKQKVSCNSVTKRDASHEIDSNEKERSEHGQAIIEKKSLSRCKERPFTRASLAGNNDCNNGETCYKSEFPSHMFYNGRANCKNGTQYLQRTVKKDQSARSIHEEIWTRENQQDVTYEKNGKNHSEKAKDFVIPSKNGKYLFAQKDDVKCVHRHVEMQCYKDEKQSVVHVEKSGGARVDLLGKEKPEIGRRDIRYSKLNGNITSQSNQGTKTPLSYQHFKKDNLVTTRQVTEKQSHQSRPISSKLSPRLKASEIAPCVITNNVRVILQYIYGFVILLSSFCNTIETIDCADGIKCGDLHPTEFFAMETFFVVIFTIDYIIRFLLSHDKLAFALKVLNIVDLLAILPYYLELFLTFLVGASDVLITFRVLRVLRLMKLTRSSPRLQALMLTLKNSFNDLLILYFIFVLGIVLFGSAIYYAEKDGSNARNFTSIPDSLWFTCVTMVTTGYGDVVPVTVFGKIFAALCGFCGVLIMSLPIPIMQERKANVHT